jgi:hypothetical protein
VLCILRLGLQELEREEDELMPERETLRRARQDKRAGKSPTTQAGEFVREEIHHIREGKHGARSAKQAIAIGLSKARRAGVTLPAPPPGSTASTKRNASSATRAAKSRRTRPSAKRAKASLRKLKREPRSAASHEALSRHAKTAAQRRPRSARRAAAKKAARTRRRETTRRTAD